MAETPPPASIRLAGASDLPAIAALQAACFEDVWGEAAIGRLLADAHVFALLAIGDGETPAGFALARVAGGEGEILSLGVAADARGRGIGDALLEAVAKEAILREAARLYLEVAVENASAETLYRRHGFHEVGRRPAYYPKENGRKADALVLCRSL